MTAPRDEYPRPQMVREDWLCLNGPWQFEIDAGDSGLERGLTDQPLNGQIAVPFCPESRLSGVEQIDFLNAVWYRREVEIPAAWAGRRVLLHFQAVDYDATVWVNGQRVGSHRGGFTPFTCDLADVAAAGDTATIVLRARDRKGHQKPGGKQSKRYGNHGCSYTRTTGVWQTVWMEPVGDVHMGRPKITPDVAGGRFMLEQPVTNSRAGTRLRATLRDEAGDVATAEGAADADFTPRLILDIPQDRRRLWSAADPHLYDLDIELLDAEGAAIDRIASYAGLRSVTIDGPAIRINGDIVFQRLVLDQGYYAAGIMTAPSEQALIDDIRLSMEAGFNGARLHQKVFEERFLYHADRMGYLVWGEYGDWGSDLNGDPIPMIPQWAEAVARDYSHPSIIGWCPLNETWRTDNDDEINAMDDVTRAAFLATKLADPTRPVLDASGYSHRVGETDVFDSHDYTQDPAKFAARHAALRKTGQPWLNPQFQCVPYAGQPFFVSEFGGVWWNPEAAEDEDSWGYGERPKTVEEFYHRFEGLCTALLDDPSMFGYCYTQLTDVFQEQNGIYAFDRSVKFDMTRLRAAQQRIAAIEANK